MRNLLLILMCLISFNALAFNDPNDTLGNNEDLQPPDGIYDDQGQDEEDELSAENDSDDDFNEQWHGSNPMRGDVDTSLTESQKYFV